jgi:CHAT domain-containing protein
VILVPDGTLAALPFEALVVEAPKKPKLARGKDVSYPAGLTYLGDRYPLRYAQSATSLQQTRALAQAPQAGKTALVVADPVFQVSDARLQQPQEQLAQRAPAGDDYGLRRMASVQEFAYGKTVFPRLDRTAALPQTLADLFGAGQVDGLTGLAATEENVKARLNQPYRYRVLATHGILDGDIPYIQEPALVLDQVGTDAKDPNRDGFLTLTEVLNLKLNSDLVALIACTTGLGKQVNGEGVMHMGRAFQFAGAKEVLMSLWSVEESSTTQLAQRLFSHLKEGKTALEALRQARTEVRQAGYEHPYFWAPFILMGG